MIRSVLRAVVAVALLIACVAADAQVAITPPIQNIRLDGPARTYAFRLINRGDQPKEMQVQVINWTMDTDGHVHRIAPTQQSLQPWMQVNPREFTIPAGGSQVVRFAVRPAVKLKPGEHRAMVFFDEVPDARVHYKPATLRAFLHLGAAVYGHVGPDHVSGKVRSLAADASGVTFHVANTGNATMRFAGRYAVWRARDFPGRSGAAPTAMDTDGYRVPAGMVRHGRLPLDATLPGAHRRVRLHFDGKKGLPPGHYVLSIRGALGRTVVSRDVRFAVATGVR